MGKLPYFAGHNGELKELYQRLLALHRESSQLVSKLNEKHEVSVWIEIRALDDEITEIWHQIREIEQIWPKG